ncbi:Lysyl oxidase-domain-containing protein [Hyaloraphidium curvatum]|nr:Lysyl oxidase-domain-containing protein [Hyaloraphidium curvatum]
MYVDIVNGSADPCLVEEKCLSGTGMRTVLRFGTLIHNLGPGNAVVGETPATPTSPAPPWFVYSTCHQHFHYVGYADYSITNPDTNATVVTGHKNGFCLMDSICPAGTNGTHDCVVQGITTGCSDYYDDGLACQWIDITDANLDARKTYILSVTVNPDRTFPETNYDNNGAKVPFQLQNLQHVSTGKLERPAIGGPPLSDGAPPIHESARSVSSNEADGVPGVPKAFADEYVLLRTHVREGDATGQGSIPVEQPKLRRRCGAGRATCGRK